MIAPDRRQTKKYRAVTRCSAAAVPCCGHPGGGACRG